MISATSLQSRAFGAQTKATLAGRHSVGNCPSAFARRVGGPLALSSKPALGRLTLRQQLSFCCIAREGWDPCCSHVSAGAVGVSSPTHHLPKCGKSSTAKASAASARPYALGDWGARLTVQRQHSGSLRNIHYWDHNPYSIPRLTLPRHGSEDIASDAPLVHQSVVVVPLSLRSQAKQKEHGPSDGYDPSGR